MPAQAGSSRTIYSLNERNLCLSKYAWQKRNNSFEQMCDDDDIMQSPHLHSWCVEFGKKFAIARSLPPTKNCKWFYKKKKTIKIQIVQSHGICMKLLIVVSEEHGNRTRGSWSASLDVHQFCFFFFFKCMINVHSLMSFIAFRWW